MTRRFKVPSVPGDHAYDVIFRATADFADLFANVAAANAAIEELKRSADDANTSSASSSKAATDAENARAKAISDAANAAKDSYTQQLLLNKAMNDGFNTPQEADAFKKQSTQTQTLYNQAVNNGRTGANAADQVVQDKKNLTSAMNDQNKSLTDMNSALSDGTKSFQDAHSAEGDFTSGIKSMDSSSKEAVLSLEGMQGGAAAASKAFADARSSAGTLDSGLSGLDSSAKNANTALEGMKSGASDASKSITDTRTAAVGLNSGLTSMEGSVAKADTSLSEMTKANDTLGSSLDKTPARITNVSKAATGTKTAMDGAKTSSEEAATAIGDVASKADSTGKSLSTAGKSATSMADALKAIKNLDVSTTMQDITQRAQALAKAISDGTISSSAASKEITALKNTINDLRSSDDGASTDLRNTLIPALGDMAKGVNANKTSMDALAKSHAAEKAAADSTSSSWKNLWGVSTSLKKGVDDLGASLDRLTTSLAKGAGSGAGGFFSALATGAASAASSFVGLISSAASMVTTFLGLGIAAGSLVSVLAALGSVIIGLMGALAPLIGVAATFLPIILGMGEAMAVLYIAIKPVVQGVKDLLNPTASAMQGFSKLSPVVQAAAKDIDAFAKAFSGAGSAVGAIQNGVLKPLLPVLSQLASTVAPVTKALTTMASAVGQFLAPILQGLVTFLKSSDFQTLTKAAAQGLSAFGGTITNVLTALEKIAVAAAPYMVQIAQWFDKFSASISSAVTQANKSGALTAFFQQMMTALKLLGDVVGSAVKLFAALGQALAPLGNGILKSISDGLDTITKAVGKVDWKTWIASVQNFLGGLGSVIGGLGTAVGFLVSSTFLNFLGSVLKDFGAIEKATEPITKFITDLIKNSLPLLSGMFDAVTKAVTFLLKPVGDFFTMLDKNKDLMKVLGDLLAVIAAVVVSASFLNWIDKMTTMLKGVTTSVVNDFIKMLNLIPGVNIKPVGTTASETSDATGLKASATSLDEAAVSLKEAAASLKGDSLGGTGSSASKDAKTAEGDAAGTAASTGTKDAASASGVSKSGLVTGAAIAATGVGLGALDINAIQNRNNPKTTNPIAQDQQKINNSQAGKDVAGAGQSYTSNVTDPILRFFSGNNAWEKTAETDIANFFTKAIPQWTKDVGQFFSGGEGWEKNAVTDVANLFTKAIPQWFSAVSSFFSRDVVTPISNFATKTIPNFFTQTVPRWFSTVSSGFNRDVVTPISNFVTKTIPAFFTQTIPRWFSSASSGFMRDVVTPIQNFITKTIPAFFTQTIPRWFTSASQGFMRDVVTPIQNFITKTIPAFFTQTIPRWFDTASNAFNRDVITPISNFVTKTIPNFFTQTIPHWFSTAASFFNQNVITPIQNFITKTIPSFFTQTIPHWFDTVSNFFNQNVITPIKNFITTTIPNFFTTTIPHWFDTVVASFTNNVITPVKNFITTTIPSFFTSTIPHWFETVVGFLNSQVVTPVKTFITTTIPSFFTSTIPHWFETVVGFLNTQIITPVKTFVTTTLPSFFTSTIPHWFDTVVGFLNSQVITPIKNFITSTIPSFFTQTIPHWFDSVAGFFTDKVITPIKTFFTTTLPTDIQNAFKAAINWVITNVINKVIGIINDVITVIPGVSKIGNVGTLASGGHVQGDLSEPDNSDSQLYRLTPGEYVLRKKAAQHLGPETLDKLNHAEKLPSTSLPFMNVPAGTGFQHDGAYGSAPRRAEGGYAGIPGYAGGGDTGPGQTAANVQGSASQAQAANTANTANNVANMSAPGFLAQVAAPILGALKAAFDGLWSVTAQPLFDTLGHAGIPAQVVQAGGLDIKAKVDTWLAAEDKKFADIGGVIPSGSQKALIDAALAADGISQDAWAEWEAGLNTLITRESNWNAGAQNNSDSNAAAGTPSQGLMQIIAPTFAAYHNPALPDNVFDAESNIAAGIRYIMAVYGGIGNVQQANSNLPAKGYKSGGSVGAAFAGSSPTSGMSFAAAPSMGAFAGGGSVGIKSAAANSANGGRSGPGVHIENMNISNPLPERVGDSLSRRLSTLRVYNANS